MSIVSYRFNPYDTATAVVFHCDHHSSRSESPAGPAEDNTTFFDNTLHQELIGQVNFEAFPPFDTCHAVPALPFSKNDCIRLFIGQIPYGTPAKQVEWMVLMATGQRVYFTETIQRWTGARSPKGCAHTYCLPQDKEAILQTLHRRVLVDDSGIWIAADEVQHSILEDYCARMKNDKLLRFRERPYQPMVAQEATSDFVPRRASPAPDATLLPPLYTHFLQSQNYAL